MYKIIFKPILDTFLAALICILILPIVLIFVVLIRLESEGPVFYFQDRLGKNGKIFKLYKLRSMKVNDKRTEIQVFANNPDITRIGHFIRRFKIDELPQLFNVLSGDMSLIGPRPCLPSLQEKFDENGIFRIKVKPGLTGWAQVNGNIYNSWPRRWELDRYYVENISFVLDIKIIFATFNVVLFGEKK